MPLHPAAQFQLDDWLMYLNETRDIPSANRLASHARSAGKDLERLIEMDVNSRLRIAIAVLSSLNHATYVSHRSPSITSETSESDMPLWVETLREARRSLELLRSTLGADDAKAFGKAMRGRADRDGSSSTQSRTR